MFRATYPDAHCVGVVECGCVESARVVRVWGMAGVPEKRKGCSFEVFDSLNPEYKIGKEQARVFAERMANAVPMMLNGDEKSGLLFRGDTGRGKSGFMACIAIARLNRGESVLWVDTLEFIDAIRKTYDDDSTMNASAVVESAQHAALLCLDDLGDMRLKDRYGRAGYGEVSDHTREKLYSVIRYRYENELPLLCTSNLNEEQMCSQFGPRLTDRIFEMCHIIPVGGKNLRFGE